MKDPIERQAIINELESWLKVEGYSEGELNIIKAVLYELQSLPSAQPEKRTEERTETHACDLISRQEAIEALKKQMSDWNDLYNISIRRSIAILEQLPSAQPGVINCKDCKYGVHAGRGDVYLCVVSPEERSEHIWDFWCAYAERRKDG